MQCRIKQSPHSRMEARVRAPSTGVARGHQSFASVSAGVGTALNLGTEPYVAHPGSIFRALAGAHRTIE